MAIARDDRWISDAQGRALAGAQVYWCTQPATTAANPPSPLAVVYTDLSEDPLTQPVITDGFGHATAYMDDSVLYTVVIWHPLFGPNPIVLEDQAIAAPLAVGNYTPFEGIPSGTVNGTNRVFTLTNGGTPLGVAPSQATVWLNFPLVPGVGYTISGDAITFTNAPISTDTIFARGWIPA